LIPTIKFPFARQQNIVKLHKLWLCYLCISDVYGRDPDVHFDFFMTSKLEH
jgi:hypothetical protein